MRAIIAPAEERVIHYPESDGEPMAETDLHRDEMIAAIEALTDFFRDDPEVYVSGNLLLYYEEGNRDASVAPDVFVARGVSKESRRIYKLWEEGKSPDVVIEMTSRSTRLQDLGTKRALYGWMGVKEYFLYDPLQEYLRPPLQGYRLVGTEYERITPAAVGALYSEELGLELRLEAGRLRLEDPVTGELLLRPQEAQGARRAAEAQAATEADARRTAEVQAATEADARRTAEAQAATEADARRTAEAQAEAEAEARRTAEVQAATEAEARRAAEAQAEAEAEARRAAEAQAEAEAEARQKAEARAAQAESELESLRAELARLRKQPS